MVDRSAWAARSAVFAKWLSSMALCIGYIIVGFDAQKRAMHDMIWTPV